MHWIAILRYPAILRIRVLFLLLLRFKRLRLRFGARIHGHTAWTTRSMFSAGGIAHIAALGDGIAGIASQAEQRNITGAITLANWARHRIVHLANRTKLLDFDSARWADVYIQGHE